MSNEYIEVSDDIFEEQVLKNSLPTIVDFWATWCRPCLALAPIVESLAGQYAGKVQVAKLNIDENPKTPARYAVRSIPTLLLIKDGQVIETSVGAVPKSKVEELFKLALD
jgi:thioredoxin